MTNAWLLVVAGCAYHPGSFADGAGAFGGTHATLGCVELGVGPVVDLRVRGPIVEYALGNRCTHAVTVDLASVRVVGRDLDGVEHVLRAHDPAHEISAVVLDARWTGREQIQYVGREGERYVSLCVDVGRIERGVEGARWICGDP